MSDANQNLEVNHQASAASETAQETAAVSDATPAPTEAEKAAEEKRSVDRRFAQLTAKWGHSERERERLAAELEALKRPAKPADPITVKPEELEREVEQRASQRLAERDMQERASRFESAGNAEFGADEFRDNCNVVAALATPQQRLTLLHVVTDIEDGHKAIAAMADSPEEAARILAMPPHRMALALTKLTATPPATPSKPFSKAPAPIKPVSGVAKAEFDESKASPQELVAYYAKQARERRMAR